MAAATARRRPTLSPVTPPVSPSVTSLPSAIPLPLPPQPAVPIATEIVPRVYLGDLYAAESGPLLASLGITHVVSAMRGALTLPPTIPSEAHLQLALDDNPFAELAAHLPRAVHFVRAALERNPNARVLIHCVRGVSRSAAVVAAVLVAQGWPPERAIAHIARTRPGSQPNIGFVQQLGEYARSLEAGPRA
jgi:predicted protein tyrosine phosphatase